MPKVSRNQVYTVVDGERDYQDQRRGNSARDNTDDNRDLGSLLTLIDVYVGKAKIAFAGPHPEGKDSSLEAVRKITALGVLTMELHGAPARK